MKFIMKYKVIILSILLVLGISLIFLLISEISKSIDISRRKKVLKSDFETFITNVKAGKDFDANMMFEENAKNRVLRGYSEAPAKSEMLEIGYVEYIQNTEYMLEYYKKFDIKKVKVKKLTENEATLTVEASRPNYLKHMDECDAENVDNPNYDFNKEFIKKINSDKVEYIDGEFEISFSKTDGVWKIMYSDNIKEMLYGKSIADNQELDVIEE